MVRLVGHLVPLIRDDYRAYDYIPDVEDGPEPSMLLTVGADASGWSYQTGDNSFTGGAYGYATWATTAIDRESNPADVAEHIISELRDAERAYIFTVDIAERIAELEAFYAREGLLNSEAAEELHTLRQALEDEST
jgi:hypothetical protein